MLDIRRTVVELLVDQHGFTTARAVTAFDEHFARDLELHASLEKAFADKDEEAARVACAKAAARMSDK